MIFSMFSVLCSMLMVNGDQCVPRRELVVQAHVRIGQITKSVIFFAMIGMILYCLPVSTW
jgi:hypothetical protein